MPPGSTPETRPSHQSHHARRLLHGGRADRRLAADRWRQSGGAHPQRADPLIARIVAGWPSRFDPQRALALGFRGDASFEEIIRVHIADELGGKIAN